MDERINSQSSDESTLSLSSVEHPMIPESFSKLNVVSNSEITVSNLYHLSEIQQNAAINNTTRKVIWAGFSIIAFGIMLALFGKTEIAIVASAAGVLTEIISGIVMVFLSQSNKSKMQYFNQVAFNEECDKYLQFLSTLNDGEKAKMIDKMIENYCSRRK